MPELIKNPHAVTREYWVDYASPIYKGVSCNVYPVEWMEWMGEWPSRICAKVVPLGGSSMSRFRFDNASSIASSLDSKYLLKPLDCFMAKVKSENFGFLISERFDIDLRDFLDDVSAGKRIARPDTLKDIFRDILLGISALNKAGLIHRDIKAANVLLRLTSSGTYKSCAIADFGIVKDVAKTMTPPGAILGTLFESAPPEAFLDSRISSSYDLFGAGMIWYRMFNADDANYAEEYALPARQQLSPMEMLEIASSASRGANATSEEIDREYLKIFYNRVKDGEDTFPKLHHCSCPYSNRTSVPPDIGAQDFLRKLLAFSPEDRFESPGKALAALGALTLDKPGAVGHPAAAPTKSLLIAVDGTLEFRKYSQKSMAILERLLAHLSDAMPGIQVKITMYESLRDGCPPPRVAVHKPGASVLDWHDKESMRFGFGGLGNLSLLAAVDSLLSTFLDKPDVRSGKSLLIFASRPPAIPDGQFGELGRVGFVKRLVDSRVVRVALFTTSSCEEYFDLIFGGYTGMTRLRLDDLVVTSPISAEPVLWDALFGGTT